MKSHYIFIRTLKKVDFSVFCVDTDQKKYYDKLFNVFSPYSSGQQVKRCMMDSILDQMDVNHAPITYNFEVNGDKLEQKEITQPCDPTYYDQLLGGWMSTPSKKNDKKKTKKKIEISDDEGMDSSTEVEGDKNGYKRRSPFSISAMTPLHPLLASLVLEEKMTYDRTESNDEKIIVRNSGGEILEEEALKDFLSTSNSMLTKRKLISGKNRVNGFFKSDIAIDLRKLFRVPITLYDMEIGLDMIQKLKNEGWVEIKNKYGQFLELPAKYHEEVAEAIAWGIVDWKITSNQSRTFDHMPILSIAVSKRADEIVGSMCGELYEIDGKIKSNLVIDNNYPNTNVYSTNILKGYLKDAETSYTAIDDAVDTIKRLILEYYSK